jgi:predicted HicB family RNase H-like nuclease
MGPVRLKERVQLNVRVQPSARKALKALAALRGQAQSEALEDLIEEALQKELVKAADDIKRKGRVILP